MIYDFVPWAVLSRVALFLSGLCAGAALVCAVFVPVTMTLWWAVYAAGCWWLAGWLHRQEAR